MDVDSVIQTAAACILIDLHGDELLVATDANLMTCGKRERKLVDDILVLLDAYKAETPEGD